MKNILGLLALTTLVGCSYSEDKFNDDSKQAGCAYLTDCTDQYDDFEDCMDDDNTDDPDASCEYDSSAAKDCVDGLEALTCENDFDDFPAVCLQVYVCDDTDA